MVEPVRYNWPQIIAEICYKLRDPRRRQSNGVGKLAELMKRQVIQIHRWQDGAEPKHYEGQMLLTIHAEYVSRETLQTESSAGASPNRQAEQSAPVRV